MSHPKLPPTKGNKVCFVGGPEAGNVRLIPESHGDLVRADNDWVYKIWPIRMTGADQTWYMAYAADQHPLKAIIDMWREYSPTAQIKRGQTEGITYSKLGQDPAKKSP